MSFWDSFFGGGSQTQTTSYDPGTRAARDRIYQLAGQSLHPYQGYSGPGQSAYGQMAGNLGLNFQQLQQMAMNPQQFTGDVAAQYMNPYNTNVIDAARKEYDLARQSGATGLAGQQGAAFGHGSRGALAMGQMYGDIARQQASTVAGLQQQGFSDAYSRWMGEQQNRQGMLGNLTNLGLGATQELQRQFTEGRDWNANQAAQYAGLVSPAMQYGDQTVTQRQSSSPFSQLLGAGLTAAGMFMNPAGGAMSLAGMVKGGMGGKGPMTPMGGGPKPNAYAPQNLGMTPSPSSAPQGGFQWGGVPQFNNWGWGWGQN